MIYFFHVEDGVCISDPNGQEFPDDASAMQEAAKVAKELSKNRIQGHPWHVLVKNADGLRIGQVPLTRAPVAEEVDVPSPSTLH
jgi:Domain of unknown function (DUF6894)